MNNVKINENLILTPLQESKTLSAKKARKKPLKHTLLASLSLQPSPPVLTPEETATILNILTTLPKLLPAKSSILWSAIKGIPKEERKAFRAQEQEQLPPHNDVRRSIILGINKVTENLETNNLDVVLLTSDINPLYMAQHILELCVLHNIPVLIVENLRNALKDTLGIASTCVGVVLAADNGILRKLCATVRKIWRKHVVNVNDESCIVLDDTEVSEVQLSVSEEDMDCTTTSSRGVDVKTFKTLHLIRPDAKSRVFVPPRAKKTPTFDADFIRIAPSAPAVSKEYVAMQVGKMRANLARLHRSKLRALGKLQPNKPKANRKQTKHQKGKGKGKQKNKKYI